MQETSSLININVNVGGGQIEQYNTEKVKSLLKDLKNAETYKKDLDYYKDSNKVYKQKYEDLKNQKEEMTGKYNPGKEREFK